jgi:hypothetical protein
MIVLIELVLIGCLSLLLMGLSDTHNRIMAHRKITTRQIADKISGGYWVHFLAPLLFIGLALATSLNIDWKTDLNILLFSVTMLFIGLSIFTSAYLRMREEI